MLLGLCGEPETVSYLLGTFNAEQHLNSCRRGGFSSSMIQTVHHHRKGSLVNKQWLWYGRASIGMEYSGNRFTFRI